MSGCPGLHCPSCGEAAGGGVVLAAVACVALAKVGASIGEWVAVIAGIAVGTLAAMALLTLIAACRLIIRDCDSRTADPLSLAAAQGRPAVAPGPRRQAITQVHNHLHIDGMHPADVARLLRGDDPGR